MSHIKRLIAQFEHELRTAADLTDFFASANAQSSIQTIVQHMSLEVMRRIKSGESLDPLEDALRTMNHCLTGIIKSVPDSILPLVLTNGSAVMILLFMVEHAQSPPVFDAPS
ncbi:hypothetical protein A3C09_02585 [Candidatus Uhrbacteria bacterium RIFCSPHIGHO2_02_FULL_47_44]|uniref:Uncharacterized protein n=1 Tax=Candidatus Uhrbacteria bacterium RIFCSPLOWO2_02_FULL_48_18 TaxID=1802408 RepID=A0A1F7V8A1_9BACT|nr:MAG: hypothetical protein A2839_00380 [Candidatus Uhrbacteria bacterium RIFCSPHIGHO2_01_FULL_47_10]OGL70189.1 MAG: hypothetical protein A3C09_02585 [Candidatus Uhrbacteria bacterium RIFCSPHIGHO2_02_FULL_47_44]OGL77576.1 MAG: hypothetical protein A3E97_04835 [Candidatus Uhrbacteria bacterium RIFCSPHIGHO2_12_FULL_47_12]OGL80438.1 MAG: hypothetical protein A3B20_03430 [Candidatus Uhrbacteria bacterium RIFCSPLOWO2_01_FULL_47_17]OGL86298.1 MAG: hypothetical protein A3I41_01910 [Candidatus Uhrbact